MGCCLTEAGAVGLAWYDDCGGAFVEPKDYASGGSVGSDAAIDGS